MRESVISSEDVRLRHLASFEYEGPVTRVVVRLVGGRVEEAGLAGTGTARCKPGDHYDRNIGADLALGRALADLGRRIEERIEPLVVTELQAQRVLIGILGG